VPDHLRPRCSDRSLLCCDVGPSKHSPTIRFTLTAFIYSLRLQTKDTFIASPNFFRLITDLQFQRCLSQAVSTHRLFPVLPSLLPQIATYRQTPFTFQDLEAESKDPSMRYNWMLGPANTVAAFCKTEETARTKALYISSFLIHPSYRGLGLGGHFLSNLLEQARQDQYTKVILKVHEDNQTAQRLYINHGFQTKQKWNKRYEMERLL
jgi:ribosomal protein S18 acetylase RimI-like enzyme